EVIRGGRDPALTAPVVPPLGGLSATDRVPLLPGRAHTARIILAVAVSFSLHAAVFVWGFGQSPDDEARAEGGSEELVLLPGESVIMIDSLPSEFSEGSEPLPEAEPLVAASLDPVATEVADPVPDDAPPVTDETAAEPLPPDVAPLTTA